VIGDPQWERANLAWSLHVEVDPAELTADQHKALFRALRIKRAERDRFLERLPGIVRSGAQIDLAPLLDRLREAGFASSLRRSDRRGERDADP
jgi:hypothetical protein